MSSKILKALSLQGEIEGYTEELLMVKMWYDLVRSNSGSGNLFNSLVRLNFINATETHQEYRQYMPSNELKELYNSTAFTSGDYSPKKLRSLFKDSMRESNDSL